MKAKRQSRPAIRPTAVRLAASALAFGAAAMLHTTGVKAQVACWDYCLGRCDEGCLDYNGCYDYGYNGGIGNCQCWYHCVSS